ncbi:hypothetical protein A8H39_00840 [Paraburkholderia fungorum]|uniref:hypothetical protein n=1 Tax=Paraburkholderia fungorum TaxID=134537 RepID=UPI00048A076C|nr:hypothetical protein [Paraburkholderia fungorum]PNE59726.1 hypothetical protein A8H39_00840 [Paraburkholderia fungorum]
MSLDHPPRTYTKREFESLSRFVQTNRRLICVPSIETRRPNFAQTNFDEPLAGLLKGIRPAQVRNFV